MKTIVFAGVLLLLIVLVRPMAYRRKAVTKPSGSTSSSEESDSKGNTEEESIDTEVTGVEDELEERPKHDLGGGAITVRNKGLYFVKFTVEYTLHDDVHTEKSGAFYKNKEKTIKIPSSAKHISLKVEQDFKVRQVIIFSKSYDKPPVISFEITGKPEAPQYHIYEG